MTIFHVTEGALIFDAGFDEPMSYEAFCARYPGVRPLAETVGASWSLTHQINSYHEWYLRNERRVRMGNIMRRKLRRLYL